MQGPITQKQIAEFDIMMFDGVCNFCSGSAFFSLPRLKNKKVRFCAMQSEIGQATLKKYGFPLTDYKTFVLFSGGEIYTKSDGLIRWSKNFKQPWPFIGTIVSLIPKGFRDRLYMLVARNRYKIMGRKKECLAPTPDIKKYFIL